MQASETAIGTRGRPAHLGFAAMAWAIAVALALPAAAQDYPSRTVKIIVPFAAGGSADVVPRVVGDWPSRKWGQPVVIEKYIGRGRQYRGGGGLQRRARTATRCSPRRRRRSSSTRASTPKLAFDPNRFRADLGDGGSMPNALVVNPANKIAAKTVADFIAYAKANPGKITVATQGNGTTSHLTSELFQLMAKVKFVQVPYRGSAPALQGLLAGDVDVMFDNLGVSLPLAQGRPASLIAVGTEKRMSALPDIPTIAETLPGFASSAWSAAVGAAEERRPRSWRSSMPTSRRRSRQLMSAQRLASLSADPVGGTVPETAAYHARRGRALEQRDQGR